MLDSRLRGNDTKEGGNDKICDLELVLEKTLTLWL